MKINAEITKGHILFWSIFIMLFRSIYVWCLMGYIWHVAGIASAYTGAHYSSRATDIVQYRCAGNYLYNYANFKSWTVSSMVSDKEAYATCKDLLKSKTDSKLAQIEAMTK
jgi:hypothetical protein